MKGTLIDDTGLQLSPSDNVITAVRDVKEGTIIHMAGHNIVAREQIEFGHKIALASISPGGYIRKYGEVIGRASTKISPGEWVHTHNVESCRGRGDITELERTSDDE
jgi:altronate dehydratase small subunit